MRRLSYLVLLCIAGCTPYRFQGEVSAFATGVSHLSDGFTSSYATLSADQAAKLQLQLTESRATVAIAPSCVVSVGDSPQSQAPCILLPRGTSAPPIMDVEKTQADTAKVLAALTSYAHGLQAVSNAADRAAYDAAVAQLSGSVGSLGGSGAAGADAIIPAGTNIAGWLVGTALDQERFDSLKQAVNAAAEPVRHIAATLAIGLEAISDARRLVLYEETTVLVKRLTPSLSDNEYKQRLAEAQATLAVLNGLRQTDPQGTAGALAKAHDALVETINNPKGNYTHLLEAVGVFSNEATTLHNALAASPKAASIQSGG